ncbi:hypothetical protein Pcar_3309 [Syntrophotalea carbinolica DSM 2380]|uniref:Uncharacterized protein n=1 Tax=Syntrophotalea carbinolica (strain DSM 2380 / NBRC 103641 / GraBd1) TaxID=338963 RepID=Q0C6K9_SYNC1|nr:hypothetical protein Pcar_3309 [Syntrophotalea carbinolica DSM 2380]
MNIGLASIQIPRNPLPKRLSVAFQMRLRLSGCFTSSFLFHRYIKAIFPFPVHDNSSECAGHEMRFAKVAHIVTVWRMSWVKLHQKSL